MQANKRVLHTFLGIFAGYRKAHREAQTARIAESHNLSKSRGVPLTGVAHCLARDLLRFLEKPLVLEGEGEHFGAGPHGGWDVGTGRKALGS